MIPNKERNSLIYSERGGLRYGYSWWNSSNATWPFAKISVYPDYIKISCLWNVMKFQKSEIESIQIYRDWLLFSGIRIRHNQYGDDPFIVFGSFSVKRLLNNIKIAGFNVLLEKNDRTLQDRKELITIIIFTIIFVFCGLIVLIFTESWETIPKMLGLVSYGTLMMIILLKIRSKMRLSRFPNK